VHEPNVEGWLLTFEFELWESKGTKFWKLLLSWSERSVTAEDEIASSVNVSLLNGRTPVTKLQTWCTCVYLTATVSLWMGCRKLSYFARMAT
jgi:hypothetical protein